MNYFRQGTLDSTRFLSTLDPRIAAESRHVAPSYNKGSSLEFLVGPGDPGPGPEPDPCVSPPCAPGEPPQDPPEEDEVLPPEADPTADCAYAPYVSSLFACSLAGAVGYWPCAVIAVCTWCEGGWVDPMCTP